MAKHRVSPKEEGGGDRRKTAIFAGGKQRHVYTHGVLTV